MGTRAWVAIPLISVVGLAGCENRTVESSAPSAAVHPDYKVTASIKDLMMGTVDPLTDVVWESVATIVTPEGTEERRPRNDEEWREVRNAAITVMEAANLLQMPGRRVTRPGEKSEFPGIELEPEEMQKLIDADRKAWAEHANALHDAMADALKAAEAKDPEGVMAAGEYIENACEACHLKYWYPGHGAPISRSDLRPETSERRGLPMRPNSGESKPNEEKSGDKKQ